MKLILMYYAEHTLSFAEKIGQSNLVNVVFQKLISK